MRNEDAAPQAAQVDFQVLRFGQSIQFDGDAPPMIADEGDVMGVFPHPDGTESVILLDPEQAIQMGEAIIAAGIRGKCLLEQWEAGNDRP